MKKAYADIPGLKREDIFIVSLAPLQHIATNANPTSDIQALEQVLYCLTLFSDHV